MQPLNAIDAITPAFTRTHEILFQPFRIGRSWKLSATQYLGMLGAFFVPMPLLLLFLPNVNQMPNVARPAITVMFVVATLLFFGLFYIGVRLQFVNFEMVVTRATFIAPMWRRYGSRVWPVVAFKAVLGTLLSLAMAPLLWKSFEGLFKMSAAMSPTPGQPPDPKMFQAMFSQMMGLEFTFFAAFLFIKLFCSAFEDFVLPFYILEDIPFTTALARGGDVFAADPLHCILYIFLKCVLAIIGFLMQYIGLIVVMIPMVLVGVVLILIGGLAFGAMGAAGHVLAAAGVVVLYPLFMGAVFWYQFATLGYLHMLLEAYATYFLASRYPLLQAMLEAGPGGPFTPPPVFPSEEERKNDDGGPPMPMNPAVA